MFEILQLIYFRMKLMIKFNEKKKFFDDLFVVSLLPIFRYSMWYLYIEKVENEEIS